MAKGENIRINVLKPYDVCNEYSKSPYVKTFKMKLTVLEMLVLDMSDSTIDSRAMVSDYLLSMSTVYLTFV